MARLEVDPDYQRITKDKNAAIQKRREENRKEEIPLLKDLRENGSQVLSVWELVNTKTPYPHLLPVLFAHLDRPYPLRVREGIARALAVRESRIYWDGLVDRYLAETDSGTNGMKWALHLAIAAAADASVIEPLIKLACDRRNARNRAMFIVALARINTPAARAALAELESDPNLASDVQRVLRKRSR